MGWLIGPEELRFTKSEVEDLEPEHVVTELKNRADAIYAAKGRRSSRPPIMREVERVVLLRNVDQEWMDHIDAMEQLQDGIRLRAYAQQDPVVEYRLEGFDMFDSMIAAIRENTAKMMLTVRLRKKGRRPPAGAGGQRDRHLLCRRCRRRHRAEAAGEKAEETRPQRPPALRQRAEVQEMLRPQRVSRQGGRDVKKRMEAGGPGGCGGRVLPWPWRGAPCL